MHKYNDELNRVIEFIKLADAKVGYIATIYAILLSFWIAKVPFIKSHVGLGFVLLYVVSLLSAIALMWLLVKCLMPKLHINNIVKKSVVYYGDIATLDVRTFKDSRAQLEDLELDDLYLDQIFINSIIASQKMVCVKKSTYVLLAFVVFTITLHMVA